MVRENISAISRFTTILYFVIGGIGIGGGWLDVGAMDYLSKISVPLLLMILYGLNSSVKNPIFFLIMSLSLLTNIFLVPKELTSLNLAMIAFMVHRIIMIYYTFQVQKIRDYIPVVLGTIPFLIIYFYLFLITNIPQSSFFLLIVQNLLASIYCGIAFSSYIMKENKANTWLLICGLLFGVMHFIFFISRIYLMEDTTAVFEPMIMALIVACYFSFLKFVLSTEESDMERSTMAR